MMYNRINDRKIANVSQMINLAIFQLFRFETPYHFLFFGGIFLGCGWAVVQSLEMCCWIEERKRKRKNVGVGH